MKVPCFHLKIYLTLFILILFSTVTLNAQIPENDDPCPTDPNPPIDLTFMSFHTGTTCEATFDFSNVDCGTATEAASVWYTYDPNSSTEQGIDITLSQIGGANDAEGPITVEVYKGAANEGCIGFSATLITSCTALNTVLQLPNNFLPNEILYIKITTDDDESQCGEFKISVDGEACGSFADFCADVTSLQTITPSTSGDFEISYDCVASCLDYAIPDGSATGGCAEFADNPTVWFRIDTDGEGQQLYTAVFTSGVWQPIWSIYKGDDCGNLTIIEANGQTCSNEDLTPDLFQVQIDPLFDTYWMAVTVDPNSIPPNGIVDGDFEVCASTVINGIVCLGTLEDDCAEPSLVFEVIEREVEGAPLSGPFCPGETVTVSVSFFYDAAETSGDWLSGFVPKFGPGWDVANWQPNQNKPFANGMQGDWYAEGVDCAPAISEDVSHLCTYINEYGNLELCNNLCEPCNECPSQGMSIGDPLPSGYFWVSNGASAGCTNDCSPQGGYGIGSVLAEVEWEFEISVKSFEEFNDCFSNNDLQISFQTFSHGVVGCWEDPVGECIIDKSQFSPLWKVDCNYPANVIGEDKQICNGATANVDLFVDDGTTPTINVNFIDNPSVTGESNYIFENGAGVIVDELVNSTSIPQIVNYIAYTESPEFNCSGYQKIIQVTVLPSVNSYLSSSGVVCAGECKLLIPEEIQGGDGGPYTFEWNTGETDSEILVCPTSDTNYSVTVTDGSGCTSESQIDLILVPALEIIAPEIIHVCKGDTFNIENPIYQVCPDLVSGTEPVQFAWDVPNGLSGNPQGLNNECFVINQELTSAFLGDLILTVAAMDQAGCVVELDITVTVTGELTVVASVADYECNETDAQISATGLDELGNPITTFYLYGGCPPDSTGDLGIFLEEGFSNSGTVTFPPQNLLDFKCFTVVGLTETGCTASQDINIPLIEGTPIEISGTSIICQGDDAIISVDNDSLFVEFFWTPQLSFESVLIDSPDSTTTYFVAALDYFGCTSQQVFTVVVEPEDSPLCADPCDDQIAEFQITGTVFSDHNGNGIQDAGEQPLSNVMVTDVSQDFTVFTNALGVYVLPSDSPDVLMEVSIDQSDWGNPTIDTIIVLQIPCVENVDFGFIPAGMEENVQISVANTITRCDWETKFFITVENLNHDDFDGTVEFTFDSKTSFFNTDIDDFELFANKVIFDTGIIGGFTSKTFIITLKMPGGSTILPMLNFKAEVFHENTLLDTYSYAEQLRCSYDPNDKRTHPDRPGDENPTLKEENLNYTIRFQNNGNDTAFHVRIVDILDPGIVKSSIRFIDASHPFEACLSGDTLIMDFPDILLVDSTTNYDASQGYISLSCNTDSTLEFGTVIHNTADIIFDSNDPIITNTVVNTIVEKLCSDTTIMLSEIICEGDSFMGYEDTGMYQDTFVSIYGCDSIVNLDLTEIIPIDIAMPSVLVCGPTEITVLDTIYLIDTSGTYNYVSIGESGCIVAMGSFDAEVIEIEEVYETFTLCDGDLLSYDNEVYQFDSSGVYEFEIEGSSGCIETLLQLDINIITPELTTVDAEICEGIVFSYEDEVYEFDSSGTYTYHIEGSSGCDEVELTFNIIVNETTYFDTDTTICEGQNYMGLEVSGTYELESFDPVNGCLVVETVNLTVIPLSDPECLNNIVELEQSTIHIYPIPTDYSLFIESEIPMQSISIFSAEGKLFKNKTLDQVVEYKVDTSTLPVGFHLMLIETNQGKVMKKVVINR